MSPTLSGVVRRAVVFTAIAVAASGTWSALEAQVEYDRMRADGRDIRMTKVAEGIYQFMTLRDSYVRQLNSVAIVNDNDVLVFDTNTRPSGAALVLEQIRKLTRKPVRYVVNSHGHPDHWSGNEVYANAFGGVDFIATFETGEHMRRMADTWPARFTTELAARRRAFGDEQRTGKRADGSVATTDQLKQDKSDLDEYASFTEETVHLRRVFPTMLFTDSLVFSHGGREFHFLSITGDADGTTVLYLPNERVLITGDAVSFPIPFGQRHLAKQADDLRRLAALDVDVIVPGHGPAFRDKNYLNLELRLFDAILAGVAKARAGGARSVEEFQKVVTVDELRDAFAHGDPDLDARFRARVAALVALTLQ
jgi:glyoxylase-like metal-dependent hydrolase (beta-lactamase superfamily II)